MKSVEQLMDKAPPQDDVQAKMEAIPFLDEYRSKVGWIGTGLCLALLSLLIFYVSARNIEPPGVFILLAPGQGGQAQPMRLPNQSLATIQGWSREVVQKTYTFDFLNYRQQLGGARKYFTPEGWQAFEKAFLASELVKSVEKNKLSVSVTPTADPVVQPPIKLKGSEFAWRVAVPVVVSFSGDTPTQSQQMVMQVLVIRVPTIDNPKGLGVQQLLAK